MMEKIYESLKPNQKGLLLVLTITLPFTFSCLYFLNKDLVIKTPFYISMLFAFCLTLLISAFNFVYSIIINSRLGCFRGQDTTVMINLVLNVGWISIWSFYCFYNNYTFCDYVSSLIALPFTPAFCLSSFFLFILIRDSRTRGSVTHNTSKEEHDIKSKRQ